MILFVVRITSSRLSFRHALSTKTLLASPNYFTLNTVCFLRSRLNLLILATREAFETIEKRDFSDEEPSLLKAFGGMDKVSESVRSQLWGGHFITRLEELLPQKENLRELGPKVRCQTTVKMLMVG